MLRDQLPRIMAVLLVAHPTWALGVEALVFARAYPRRRARPSLKTRGGTCRKAPSSNVHTRRLTHLTHGLILPVLVEGPVKRERIL
jgi:hypothetical protein